MKKSTLIRPALAAGVASAAAASFVLGGSPAGASNNNGELAARGLGATFAAPGLLVEKVVAPGGTATDALRIINTGTSASQYVLRMSDDLQGQVETVLAGSVNVTSQVSSAAGYLTPLIGAGQAETLQVDIAVPATASQTDSYFTEMDLFDATGTTHLAETGYYTNVEATGGTAADDIYATTAGSLSVVAQPNNANSLTSWSLTPGAITAYRITLRNDSSTAAQVTSGLISSTSCGKNFPIFAISGLANVTSALFGGTFKTPVLAPGHQSVIWLYVGYPTPKIAGCDYDLLDLTASAPGTTFSLLALPTNTA